MRNSLSLFSSSYQLLEFHIGKCAAKIYVRLFFLLHFIDSIHSAAFFFDTRAPSGNYYQGPDGSLQYASIPTFMDVINVSNGQLKTNGQLIPRGVQIWQVSRGGKYMIESHQKIIGSNSCRFQTSDGASTNSENSVINIFL